MLEHQGKGLPATAGPAMQSPGLLEPGPEELGGGEMSCAEMAAANLQSLTINSRIASEAADFLARLLITKDLKRFGWECNLAAGSAKSHYTTPQAVAHLIRQPVDFVRNGAPHTELSGSERDEMVERIVAEAGYL